jgi:predicted transposase YdaD
MKALAVAQELLALGLSVDMVVQATKLAREEVETLTR